MKPASRPSIATVPDTESRSDLDLPWTVIVHDDPINLMSYVTMVFMRVFRYPRERAEQLMLEVHNSGRSLVWTGEREQAEHYTHQLHAYQLLATLERSFA